MKKWDIVALATEIGGAICAVIGLIAASKKEEDLEDKVHRLMLEDKSYGKNRKK